MKTDDADWVEDVRRWYFNGGRSPSAAAPQGLPGPAGADASAPEVGYEAAHPSLQSSAWSTPPATEFGSLG